MKDKNRELICAKCGNKYIGHFNSKYCTDCLAKGSHILRKYGELRADPVEKTEEREPKICGNCGKEFTNYHGNQRYCCEKCRIEKYRLSQNAYHRKWYAENRATSEYKEKTCCVCGNKYQGRGRSIYCDDCLNKMNHGTRYRLKRRNERRKAKEIK